MYSDGQIGCESGLLGVLLFAGDVVDGGGGGPEEAGAAAAPPTDCSVLRHVAALCILASWTEMIILVAKHPRLSRYQCCPT